MAPHCLCTIIKMFGFGFEDLIIGSCILRAFFFLNASFTGLKVHYVQFNHLHARVLHLQLQASIKASSGHQVAVVLTFTLPYFSS